MRRRIAGLDSKNLAKLRDGRIQAAGITEGLPQTQVSLDEIRPERNRLPVLGNGCFHRTGFLQQSPQVISRLDMIRIQRHGPARMIERFRQTFLRRQNARVAHSDSSPQTHRSRWPAAALDE